jgi:MoxR-like ATPase
MTQLHPSAETAASRPTRGDWGDHDARDALWRVRSEVAKVVVGQDEAVTGLLMALLTRGHVLLEGAPGTAKTLLVRALSLALSVEHKRVQFTPDLMPGDVTGSLVFNAATSDFSFRPGPVFTNLLLADEINRTPPKTQASLLEAMAERTVTIDGQPRDLPDPFLVAATQNPIEYEGTYPLPEAQLDRFLLRLKIGYPDEDEERAIIDRFEDTSPLAALQPVAHADELVAAAIALSAVHVEGIVRDYIVQLVQATRRNPGLELGASPRASLALFRGARALAAIRGRAYVIPDDVKLLAPHVLPHRLILASNARLRGRDTAAIVAELLESTPAPVLE